MDDYIITAIKSVYSELNVNFIGELNFSTLFSKYKNLKILSYSEVANKMRISFNEFLEMCESEDGFFVSRGNFFVIYFNDKRPLRRIRFTLAHEFAHYILGHTDESSVNETEANWFARNLLCNIYESVKICSLSTSFESTISNLSNYFNVSLEMAEVRLNQIENDFRDLGFDFPTSLDFSKESKLMIEAFVHRQLYYDTCNVFFDRGLKHASELIPSYLL